MRKLFTKIALCVAVMGIGIGTAGCGSDTIQQIIEILIGGKTYVYQGDYTMQLYGPSSQSNTLTPLTETLTYTGTKVSVTTGTGVGGAISNVKLVVPGTNIVEGVTMSEVTLNYLSLTNDQLTVSDASRGTGTLTINGSTLDLYTVDLTATVTTDVLNIQQLVVYFGETGDYAVKITFVNGKVIINQ